MKNFKKEAITNSLEKLEEHFSSYKITLEDSEVAIRVVGEFSSGKTRFIREFLDDIIPKNLQPISSMEVQTRLPLEITYGETLSLDLSQGTFGHLNRKKIKKFDYFPHRSELEGYSQHEYSLQLTIPENRLTLKFGDGVTGDENSAMRFCLIDSLGWNSEDNIEDSDEFFSSDWYNLSLIYITTATKIESQFNKQIVEKFVQAFESGDLIPLKEKLPILCIITKCPKNEEDGARARLTSLFDSIMKKYDINKDDYPIDILCVEFDSMTLDEKNSFKKKVWNIILSDAPSKPVEKNNIEASMKKWDASWDIRPYIDQSLEEYYYLLDKFSRAYNKGEYIYNASRSNLDGYDSINDARKKLMNTWYKQLQVTSLDEIFQYTEINLPSDHPLSSWWENYWTVNLEENIEKILSFFETIESSIESFEFSVDDLSVYFIDTASHAYSEAVKTTNSPFALLCKTMHSYKEDSSKQEYLASLLSLSLIEASYSETSI